MGKVKKYKGKFLTFHQARRITRKLGLKSRVEWDKLCKSKERPKNIPAYPHLTYKGYGWTNYADFFGYKKYLPFKQARGFIRSLEFKTTAEWRKYSSSGKRPKNIPSNPKVVYKGQYKGSRDWLGLPEKRFLPFTEARKYVRSIKNLTGSNWWEWSKAHRPSNIPCRPDIIYKNKGWKSWGDWFGNYKGHRKDFLPYKKARALARTLGIKGSAEWHLLCKQGKKPEKLPTCLNAYYKEFVSCSDFFGYKRRKKAKKKRG